MAEEKAQPIGLADKDKYPEVLLTNIQGWSVNDGPGIRTTLFIKGCPLKCKWCHNPETVNDYPEIYYKRKNKCVQCGACYQACPVEGAINPPIPYEEAQADDCTYHKINRELCTRCMKCVEACKYDALVKVGEHWPMDKLMNELTRDFGFYLNSGGGVTVSGGEGTTRPEYILEVLKGLKAYGIHTCIETCCYVDWDILQKFVPLVDLFLIDIKHMDSLKHREATGVPNELILANIKRLADAGAKMRIRLPIIPGFNDSEEHIERIGEFLSSLGSAVEGVDVLPYHNYCETKYEWLDLVWPFPGVEALPKSAVAPLEEILKSFDLQTTIGG